MKLEQFTVTLSLSPEQVNQLSGLTRLYNDHLVSEGRCPGYTECSYLQRLLSSQLTRILSDELDYYKKRGLAGDVPTRNPSPEVGPEEPGADGEEEEPVEFIFSVTEGNMIHDALCSVHQNRLARRFPHTWLFPVEDESLYNAVWKGDTPITLTVEECKTISDALYVRGCSRAEAGYETIANEHFDLARRIGGADGVMLDEGPETLITVRDASGVVREVTLDEVEEMREAAQGIYNGEPPEPDFEPDAPEEEPETVSNAEDKRSPLIKDNSDGYFYYLEHGHWPSDDEVLAGADVPCTGDYGLSDCLVVTQSALDFVDAFFVGQEAGT